MKKIIFILILLPTLLVAFEQTGPPGVDLWLMEIDDVTGYCYTSTNHNKLYKVDLENNIWTELTPLAYGEKIESFAVHNDVIFLGIGNHIVRSLDGGNNWEYCEEGIQYDINLNSIIIVKDQPEIVIAQIGLNIWYRSDNNGNSWDLQLPDIGGFVYDISPEYDFMMVITYSMYKSFDNGLTWAEIPFTFFNDNFFPFGLAIIDSSTYVCGGFYENDPLCFNNIFITYDGGSTWSNINFDFSFGFPKEIIYYNDEIYLATARTRTENDAGIYQLDLDNETWNKIGSGFATDVTGISLSAYQNKLYLASLYEGIFEYEPTTNQTENLIPQNIYEKTIFTLINSSNFPNYYYQNESFMYLSDDYGNSWSRIDSVYNVLDVKQSPENENVFVASRARKGIYLSDDTAQTWIESNAGIEEQDRTLIHNVHFVNSDTLLISGYQAFTSPYDISFIYRSVDRGGSWEKVLETSASQGEGYILIKSLVQTNNELYAAFFEKGIFKSDDWGITWEPVFTLDETLFIELIYDNINEIFFTTTANLNETPGKTVIYKSVNGIDWDICSQSFHEDYWVTDILTNPSEQNQIYCTSFSRYYPDQNPAPHFIYSLDSGENWEEIYFDEFEPTLCFGRSVINPETNEILVTPKGNSIYKTNLDFVDSEELTILLQNSNHLTNHPNPFNPSAAGAGRSPSTTISFNLNNQQNEQIELEIYNIKGQKVKEFQITNYELGINQVVWNGKNDNGKPVASGVYFYQLKINNEPVASKKCLLLK